MEKGIVNQLFKEGIKVGKIKNTVEFTSEQPYQALYDAIGDAEKHGVRAIGVLNGELFTVGMHRARKEYGAVIHSNDLSGEVNVTYFDQEEKASA